MNANIGAARRDALVDAAKDVCDICGKRYYPHRAAPLAGPNDARLFEHHLDVTTELSPQPCKASSIWMRIVFEWDLDEVKAWSPRGFLIPERKE